jgi:hypothetical protein
MVKGRGDGFLPLEAFEIVSCCGWSPLLESVLKFYRIAFGEREEVQRVREAFIMFSVAGIEVVRTQRLGYFESSAFYPR